MPESPSLPPVIVDALLARLDASSTTAIDMTSCVRPAARRMMMPDNAPASAPAPAAIASMASGSVAPWTAAMPAA